jgi:hypothetical protein
MLAFVLGLCVGLLLFGVYSSFIPSALLEIKKKRLRIGMVTSTNRTAEFSRGAQKC